MIDGTEMRSNALVQTNLRGKPDLAADVLPLTSLGLSGQVRAEKLGAVRIQRRTRGMGGAVVPEVRRTRLCDASSSTTSVHMVEESMMVAVSTFHQCEFRGYNALYGGGYSFGTSSASFFDAQFLNNTASSSGG